MYKLLYRFFGIVFLLLIFPQILSAQLSCSSSSSYDDWIVTDYITNVSIQGVSLNYSNSSTCATNRYSDYSTGKSITIKQGKSYIVKVRKDQSSPCATNVRIWIDFNQDGVFQENEILISNNKLSDIASESYFVIEIPKGKEVGKMKMRVQMAFGNKEMASNMNPCKTPEWGETEDYMLNVTPH